MSNKKARVERRAAKRREERSAREQMIEKFGARADERATPDRRQMTREEQERILKQMGMEDRRRTTRRKR